jgi:hypothetical protein
MALCPSGTPAPKCMTGSLHVQKCPERFGYLADRSSCPDHWKRVILPALEIVKRAS